MGGKLSAVKVAALKKPGRYYDVRNLALVVEASGRKSWAFLYMLNGRAREMSLGNLDNLSLAEAREEAGDWANADSSE